MKKQHKKRSQIESITHGLNLESGVQIRPSQKVTVTREKQTRHITVKTQGSRYVMIYNSYGNQLHSPGVTGPRIFGIGPV